MGTTNDKQKPFTTPAHHPLPPPKEGNRRGITGELSGIIPPLKGAGGCKFPSFGGVGVVKGFCLSLVVPINEFIRKYR